MMWISTSFRVCTACQNSRVVFHRASPVFLRPHLRHSTTGQQSQGRYDNAFFRYLRNLKWVPLPVGVGFAYIGYQHYGHVVERENDLIRRAASAEELAAADWQVRLYRALPLKALSRAWGRVNSIELPLWMREPVFKLYIWAFNVNLEEAAVTDLQFYHNLGDFFRRRLTQGVRPVDKRHCVTCPSDGKVLHFGRIDDNGMVEQVKGLTYSLQEFLGPSSWQSGNNNPQTQLILPKSSPSDYHKKVLSGSNTALYHCVIYLAPGDYHGFHSPTDWTVTYRRHFPGDLLSVNPGIARLVRGLFNLNERVAYMGSWQHGFFSMVAVGATNVGSIKVFIDNDLNTNSKIDSHGYCHDLDYTKSVGELPSISGMPMKKGEAFGEFNLGSTIVLVFEAPKDFQFKIKEGQTVLYGQPLGHADSKRNEASG